MRSPPTTRCPIHGTVLGPQGTCILCRNHAPEERPAHWGRLVFGLAVAVTALGVFARLRSHADTTLIPEAFVDASSAGAERLESAQGPMTAASIIAPAPSSGGSRFEHAPFRERDPRGFRAELQARGERDLSGDYQARDESLEMVLPSNLSDTDSIGLLVWISATDSGALPKPEWAPILAAHRLIFVGPNRAGNDREIASRLGLALDSVLAARRRVHLDTHRLFIGGVSGGAKTAFRTLLYFPEIFRGALLCAGIEYIRDVPIRSQRGSFWPQRIPVPSDLNLAKLRPIVVTTGPRDFNYAQIRDVVAALGQDQFSRVAMLESLELTHDVPPAQMFERSLAWLENHSN